MTASIPFTDLEQQIHTLFADLKTVILTRFDTLQSHILQSLNPNEFPPSPISQLLPFIRRPIRIKASGGELDLLGDFGARDPFPAEIESNFAEKVMGNVSTEHKILIPNASALSLAPTISALPVHGFLGGYVFFNPIAAAFDLEDKIVLVGEENVGNEFYQKSMYVNSIHKEKYEGPIVFDTMD